MNETKKFTAGQEAEALEEAIRELKEAQSATQLALLNEKLVKVSTLLAVVQV
jgi:hypothetical protein